MSNPSNCGKDALGAILAEDEEMICLCCGARAFARPKHHEDDGFDYNGSAWARLATFEKCRRESLPGMPEAQVRSSMLSMLRR
jgi:hypothetical protein